MTSRKRDTKEEEQARVSGNDSGQHLILPLAELIEQAASELNLGQSWSAA